MQFDESRNVASGRSQLADTAIRACKQSKSLEDIADRWITAPGRDIRICNGLNYENHFDSVCLVLRQDHRTIAERYLKRTSIVKRYPHVRAIGMFANWTSLYIEHAQRRPVYIPQHFDRSGFAKSVEIPWEARFDTDLELHVLSRDEGLRLALSHALSAYSEATISHFSNSFFDEDSALLKRWGKRNLWWLFSTTSAPHPIGGDRPFELGSVLISDTFPRAFQKENKQEVTRRGQSASEAVANHTAWFSTVGSSATGGGSSFH